MLTVGDDGNETGPDGLGIFDPRGAVERQSNVVDARRPRESGILHVRWLRERIERVAFRPLDNIDVGVWHAVTRQRHRRHRVASADDACD